MKPEDFEPLRLPIPTGGVTEPTEVRALEQLLLLRVLRLTTGHLSAWTWERVLGGEQFGHVIENWGDASFVAEVVAHDEIRAISAPEDLKLACALARQLDVQHIKFDPIGAVARRLPQFCFTAGAMNYPRDGRRELAVRLDRGVAVLELAEQSRTWLELLTLDSHGEVLRRSIVPTSLNLTLGRPSLLATVIETSRLLDGDERMAGAVHDAPEVKEALGQGDVVRAVQLLHQVKMPAPVGYSATVNAGYGTVSYFNAVAPSVIVPL